MLYFTWKYFTSRHSESFFFQSFVSTGHYSRRSSCIYQFRRYKVRPSFHASIDANSSAVIVIMRAWVVWGRRKVILSILLAFFAVTNIASMVIIVLGVIATGCQFSSYDLEVAHSDGPCRVLMMLSLSLMQLGLASATFRVRYFPLYPLLFVLTPVRSFLGMDPMSVLLDDECVMLTVLI